MFEIENGVLKKYSFDGNTAVVIPDGVEVIGREAFVAGWHTASPITSIVIPDSVKKIEDSAFYYCSNLTEITIPDSVTEIGSGIFYECSLLKKVTLSRNLCEIPWSTFNSCSALTDITLPEGITAIGPYAFFGCRFLSELVIHDGVTTIGEDAFSYSDLYSVRLPDSLTELRDRAFQACGNLQSVTLPAGLKRIGAYTFKRCAALSEITIPDSVELIGSSAFSFCPSLNRVVLGKGVQAIDSSVFSYDSALTEIVLSEGLTKLGSAAFQDCTALTCITLPDGLQSIGSSTFSGCTALERIILPDSIQSIGNSSFSSCRALTRITLPAQITRIENELLSGCSALTEITLPEGVTYIGTSAFQSCTALTAIRIPGSVRYIENGAFRGCSALCRVTLPCSVNIGTTAFDQCPNVSCEIVGGLNLRTTDKLPASFATLNPDASDEDRAHVVLRQSAKAWQMWAAYSTQNPDAVVEACLTLLTEEKKIPATLYKSVVGFMIERETDLKPETIVKMLDFLKSRKCKVDADQFRSISALGSDGKKANVHPMEAFVQELLKTYTIADEALTAVKKSTKIHYASGEGVASTNALYVLVSESVYAWRKRKYLTAEEFGVEMLSVGTTASFSEIADKIADALDRRELCAFLAKLTSTVGKYRPYALAHGRYADEEGVAELASAISQNTRGVASQRYMAENLTIALMHNDTRAAMLWMDKHGRLEQYAKMRSITALELRDSLMMPQFDFDADGIKRYDIGGNVIEVSILSNLSFQLFDTEKKKVVKSIPKKSSDPAKAAACAEELKVFKKTVQDFYKLRTGYMHDLHLSGDSLSAEIWHDIYLNHPVLKLLTRMLIWQDETMHSFLPTEGGIVDAQGNAYAPQGRITLAHVLSMSAEDVSAWQKYLTDHALVQPFAQMWEAIVPFNSEEKDFFKRYEDVVLTKAERSTLKKELTAWGVGMRSIGMEREFNARQWSYEYSNESSFSFDGCMMLEYAVNPDEDITTLGTISYFSKKSEDARRINAVLLHLDRAAIRARIAAGDDAAVNIALQGGFTAAQISEFIELSTALGQTSCTAVLLQYKNDHFADLTDMDEFSLDW